MADPISLRWLGAACPGRDPASLPHPDVRPVAASPATAHLSRVWFAESSALSRTLGTASVFLQNLIPGHGASLQSARVERSHPSRLLG